MGSSLMVEENQLMAHNSRNAGRKRNPRIVQAKTRASVWKEDQEKFSRVVNRSEFVRDAISEKLRRGEVEAWGCFLPSWCKDLAGLVISRPEFKNKSLETVLEAALLAYATASEREETECHFANANDHEAQM